MFSVHCVRTVPRKQYSSSYYSSSVMFFTPRRRQKIQKILKFLKVPKILKIQKKKKILEIAGLTLSGPNVAAYAPKGREGRSQEAWRAQRTKPRGPEGLQLEVGSRLLVHIYLYKNKLTKARKMRKPPGTLGLKKFGPGKIWVENVWTQKSFWVKKVFG